MPSSANQLCVFFVQQVSRGVPQPRLRFGRTFPGALARAVGSHMASTQPACWLLDGPGYALIVKLRLCRLNALQIDREGRVRREGE